MKILVLDNKTNKELFEIEGLRKNIKIETILDKIKENIRNIYGINVSRFLPTGTLNYATGESNISYVIFGENTNNLPTRNIKIVKEGV